MKKDTKFVTASGYKSVAKSQIEKNKKQIEKNKKVVEKNKKES
ncbi:hypothetical protein [Geomicrobium sediminis]|uniref:Uncharacterized protein n=1 Tax=Geomicrobium sediminis TaxID=1347788 RepID=A0ABS2PFP4_9BACL|nr:hypothetical protein [Geomicrobium sediminis]MBM7634252.1 hypothetical protein [Geomicrobium sediminis]